MSFHARRCLLVDRRGATPCLCNSSTFAALGLKIPLCGLQLLLDGTQLLFQLSANRVLSPPVDSCLCIPRRPPAARRAFVLLPLELRIPLKGVEVFGDPLLFRLHSATRASACLWAVDCRCSCARKSSADCRASRKSRLKRPDGAGLPGDFNARRRLLRGFVKPSA